MENIEIDKEIEKIESFINKNFVKLKNNSTDQKRFVKYAFYLEKIKREFYELNKENSKNLDKIIINDILNLKKIILENHKPL